jgi:hypothetical protein
VRVALAATLILFQLSQPAYSATFGDGSLEGGPSGTVTVVIGTGNDGSSYPSGPGADATRPLVQYVLSWSVDETPAQVGSLNGLCLIGGGTPHPTFGFEYHLVGRDASGAIVDDRFECIAFPDGDTSVRPPAPALPAVPTFAEAWNSVQLPAPTVTFDPADHGITGLETRISTTGPTTLTIAATIRGYAITGTATLDHYMISVDGGPPDVTDSTHYTFETKGRHLVAVSAVWQGVATLTGPDLPTTLPAIDLGEATITATRPYTVNEIRSVLQP